MSVPRLEDSARSLRLLVVTPRFLPHVGGTELHTHETTRRVAAAGHDVTVLTTLPRGELPAEEWIDGVRVFRVPGWPAGTDFELTPGMTRIIARGEWDLVHCQGMHTFIPPMAMLAALRARIPYILTFHSGGHSSRLRSAIRGTQHRALRLLLSKARRLIGVSRFEADFFREQLRLPATRFAVIPNGTELPDLPEARPTIESGNLIVSIGRLERYKGHHSVIAALPYVLAQQPDVRLRIVGSGPYEGSLRRLTSSLGLTDRVEIGSLPASGRAEMARLLSNASLVTILSDYESQGIAAMEALHLRRPVLVSDTSALRELAQRGLARSVPLSSDPEQIGRAMLEQLRYPLMPPAIELPTWDACAEELISLYQTVARRPLCVS